MDASNALNLVVKFVEYVADYTSACVKDKAVVNVVQITAYTCYRRHSFEHPAAH